MKTPVLVVIIVGTVIAGCIAPPGESPAGDFSDAGGSMTAKESQEESVALCSNGLGLPASGQYCAERVILVEGDASGIGAMEVDLATFNGQVQLEEESGDGWSLKAVLRARGSTEADAKANLDRIRFTWSHVEGDAHRLFAKAESPPSSGGTYGASLRATLPSSILLRVSATTANGAVDVLGVRTDGLSAQTSNGAVNVDASVTSVSLQTSNGAIDARLTPTGSGRITATTSNGAISLTLPEDARHGYDLDAQTSNGRVTVNLQDGETTRRGPSNPYYDPQNDAHFTTHGYASREIQSSVRLVTSNGGITVSPR